MGLREAIAEAGFPSLGAQRMILCKAARVLPDAANWSPGNVERELAELLSGLEWFQFYDVVERARKFFPEGDEVFYGYSTPAYDVAINRLFAEEGVGWRMKDGRLIRPGTEEFGEAVESARGALASAELAEPRCQFERALELRNARPPDWPNAIKEAVNSVEASLQILSGRPGVAMSTLVTDSG